MQYTITLTSEEDVVSKYLLTFEENPPKRLPQLWDALLTIRAYYQGRYYEFTSSNTEALCNMVNEYQTNLVPALILKLRSQSRHLQEVITRLDSIETTVKERLPPTKKKLPCYSMMNTGKCRYGDRCHYSHRVTVIAQNKPCPELVSNGTCKFGDRCRYRHDIS